MDGAGRVTEWNPAAERTFGVPRGQAIGAEMADLIIPPRFRDAHRAGLAKFLQTGQEIVLGKRLELSAMRADGQEFPVELTIMRVEIDGPPAFTGFLRDITVSRAAQKELERGRALFQGITDATPDVLTVYDLRTHRVEYANREITDSLGYTADQVKAMGDSVLAHFIHPADLARIQKVISEFDQLADGQVSKYEYRARRADGTYRWMATRAVVFSRSPDGRAAQVLSAAQDVTEGREAEAALRASEERLRLGLEAGKTALWDWDLDAARITWSDRLFMLHGLTRDQFDGSLADAVKSVHPDDAEQVGAAIQSALADERDYAVDYRVIHPATGEIRWLTSTGRVLRDERGRPVRMLGAATDITDRKRSEARDRFRIAVDEAVRPLTDPEHITAVCARLLAEHLQADRCAYADVEADQDTFNLTGDYNRGVPSVTGRYQFADFGQQVLSLMRADEPYVVEDVQTHEPPVGDLTYYRQMMIRSVVCVPLRKEGRFVAAMAVHQTTPRRWRDDEVELVRHVAARCWESIERSRVARTLRESESRLRAVLEASPECVKVVGSGGELIYMNQAGLDMMECQTLPTPEEVRIYGFIAPEHRPQWHLNHAAVCAGNRLTWQFELIGRLGTRRWMESHSVPLQLPDGQVGQLAVTRDVTERKAAEQERERLLEAERAARAEAERASRLKDDFLTTVSHELRTPLNAIMGYAQLLRHSALDADTAQGLEVIERNARIQGQIIEDLLDMSRIVSGRLRLDVQHVDLQKVIDAAVETVQPAADARSVRLSKAVDPHVGPVNGDPARLQQVIWNLLANAVKFTPKGGRVQVTLARINSHIEIAVSDTGQGIEPDFLPYVFDKFRQADATTTRRHGGLGVGLSIVKNLVEMHGGSIRAQSAGEGRGATFVVSLPLLAVHRSASELPRRHPRSGPVSSAPTDRPSLQGVTVLAVDDEPDARELVRRLLEDFGARVLVAASAEEALSAMDEEKVDVLLSDIGMPKIDGYALLRAVRKREPMQGGQVPAAALTAFARSEDRTRALMAGFQTHIAKPVEPIELVFAVASLARRTGR